MKKMSDLSLHNFRYLDISGCHGVTDIGVMSLLALPNLETINLSYLNQVTTNPKQVTSYPQQFYSVNVIVKLLYKGTN